MLAHTSTDTPHNGPQHTNRMHRLERGLLAMAEAVPSLMTPCAPERLRCSSPLQKTPSEQVLVMGTAGLEPATSRV
jgi:hypothetical protein